MAGTGSLQGITKTNVERKARIDGRRDGNHPTPGRKRQLVVTRDPSVKLLAGGLGIRYPRRS
jgi:hypothetical protein